MPSHSSYHSNQHLSIKNWKQEKNWKRRGALSHDRHSNREIVIFDQPTLSTSFQYKAQKIRENEPGWKKIP